MITIIDSGVANISSVLFALQRISSKEITVTAEPQKIQQASHVIFPGVGAAQAAMQNLQQKKLIDTIKQLTQPILGICLGMQLLYEFSQENDTNCLGVIDAKVEQLKPSETQTKLPIPHMGWNTINKQQESSLLHGIDERAYFYFVHSFAAPITENTLASCDYTQSFTAVCQHKNFYGTQFHPERSGKAGERLLQNFLEL